MVANLPVLPSELRNLTFEHLLALPGARRYQHTPKAWRSDIRTGQAPPYTVHSPAVCLARSSPNSCTPSLTLELSPLADVQRAGPEAFGVG